LVLQKAIELSNLTQNNYLKDRLKYIIEQSELLKNDAGAINVGKLKDFRFGSKFKPIETKSKNTVHEVQLKLPNIALKEIQIDPTFERPLRK